MRTQEEYRKRAASCLKASECARSLPERTALVVLSEAWLKLAYDVELGRNIDPKLN